MKTLYMPSPSEMPLTLAKSCIHQASNLKLQADLLVSTLQVKPTQSDCCFVLEEKIVTTTQASFAAIISHIL